MPDMEWGAGVHWRRNATVPHTDHQFIPIFYPFLILFFFSFYYYFFIFFTLQYCIGFSIHQHASATGVHVFPILNPPPSHLPLHTIPLSLPSSYHPYLKLELQGYWWVTRAPVLIQGTPLPRLKLPPPHCTIQAFSMLFLTSGDLLKPLT